MTIKTQTRDVGPLSMRASLGTVNAERRTVDIIWTTGARVLRSSWMDGPFYEELSLDPKHVRMDRLNNGAPFLANHNGYDVARTLGVIESARIEGGKGYATVRFAKAEDDAEADKVFRKIADGIIQNVSVGYRIYKVERIESVDEKIPTVRVIDWEPSEVSAVAMGADDGAGFRSADAEKTNPCLFTFTKEQNRMDPEELKRQEEAKAQQAARALELEAATRAAALAERERASGINAACRAAQLDSKVADKLITDGTSLDAARAFVLEQLAERSDSITTNVAGAVERGADDQDQFVRGLSDALLQRVPEVREAVAKKLPGFEKMTDGGHFRGMRLSDIARLCAERNGHKISGIYDMERIIGYALQVRNGYATPSDFPILFEDIARKSMDAGYAIQADTWQRFVSVTNVSDFKDSSRYQAGSFGSLPVVKAGDEYKNIAIPDGAKMVINTETRGGIIALGREAIINDDLGFLTSAAAMFGGTAAHSIEVAAYAFLAAQSGTGPDITRNGVTAAFFNDSAWGNVSTSAALSGAALSLDRAHMRKQKDVSLNKTLDLMPRILMVALPLEDLARSINTDTFDHDGVKFQKRNQQAGMFSDIITKPLAPVLTGAKRYLFTEDKGAIICVFGPGGNGPNLTSQDGFRRDGVEYKVRIDFKINAGDPKKAIYNAGG